MIKRYRSLFVLVFAVLVAACGNTQNQGSLAPIVETYSGDRTSKVSCDKLKNEVIPKLSLNNTTPKDVEQYSTPNVDKTVQEFVKYSTLIQSARQNKCRWKDSGAKNQMVFWFNKREKLVGSVLVYKTSDCDISQKVARKYQDHHGMDAYEKFNTDEQYSFSLKHKDLNRVLVGRCSPENKNVLLFTTTEQAMSHFLKYAREH